MITKIGGLLRIFSSFPMIFAPLVLKTFYVKLAEKYNKMKENEQETELING